MVTGLERDECGGAPGVFPSEAESRYLRVFTAGRFMKAFGKDFIAVARFAHDDTSDVGVGGGIPFSRNGQGTGHHFCIERGHGLKLIRWTGANKTSNFSHELVYVPERLVDAGKPYVSNLV
jgi:hypothetical protein